MRILDLLRRRYQEPEWFTTTEVTIGDRRADFIAANLWQSRGREIVLVEIKSSRGDWLRELKNPSKQERLYMSCDKTYLAITDPSIAKVEEVPKGWGLLVQQGSRLTTKVQPIPNPEAKTPRELYCRLIQHEMEHREGIIRKEVESRMKALADSAESRQTKDLERQVEGLQRVLRAQEQSIEFLRVKNLELIASCEAFDRMKDLYQDRTIQAIRLLERMPPDQIQRVMDQLGSSQKMLESLSATVSNLHQILKGD